MEIKKVAGKDQGEIMLYALSTCGWCRRTKDFLNGLGFAYSYLDVDLLEGEEKDKVVQEITKWNPACSFPTIVFKGKSCVIGYNEDNIREQLGL